MAESETGQSWEQRFDADGLDLTSSIDNGQPPRYPLLVNVRQIRRGEFRSRPALNALSTAPAAKTPWHSLRRLNDKSTAQYTHVSGIGTELFTTPAAAAAANPGNPISRDTGYSGNPLTLLPFKPENDTAEWMAVVDANRQRKVRLDGTVHQLGLPQPTRPPDIGLDWVWGLQRRDLEPGTGAAGWAASAPGAIAANTLVRTNANCTVVRSLWGDGYDPTGGLTSGWLSIEVQPGPPSGLANIGPGTLLLDAAARLHTVEEIHPPTPGPTTISQILFDDVGGQWASLVPLAAYREFAQHAIVHAVHGGVDYYGVVTAVVHGPDNSVSLRVFFSGSATALVSGDSVEIRPTIYAFCPLGYPAGALVSSSVRYQNLNTVSTNYLLVKGGLGLSLSAYPISNKQVDHSQDEMHVSLQATDWTLVDSIKIQLDLDDGTFLRNFVSRTIRQSDLLALQTNTLGPIDVRDTEVRNDTLDSVRPDTDLVLVRTPGDEGNIGPIYDPALPPPSGGPGIDTPGGSSSQGTTGTNQWSEIRFKMSDLLDNRAGSDLSKGLQSIVAFQVIVTRNATVGVLDVALGSWWVGGGSPPDIFRGAPYEYRYRYRVSSTGARSNWSPPGRTLAWPHRYSVYVQTYTNNTVGNPPPPAEVDKIDIQRRGGSVTPWVTIGTVDKGGGDPYFTDIYDDIYALGTAEDPLSLEGNVNDQPLTVQQPAFVDTVTTVAGTLIKHVGAFAGFLSGGAQRLQQGVGVVVNGVSTLLYRVLSADLIEVFDNVGAGTNFKLEIPSPFYTSQPPPVAFGPVDGWYFAVGDSKNPGRLYAFNHNTLDSASGSLVTDITDPGDPLQNGCVHLGRGYLWSADAMFALSIDPSASGAPVRVERLVGSSGMLSRYALAVGDAMYWLGKDGIYASEGGGGHNITAGTLSPLFPTAQIEGSDTNTIAAPSLTAANAAADGTALHQFRLSYTADRTLWFDYPDSGGVRRSLGLFRGAGVGRIVDTGDQAQWGWWYDTYANGALFHYSEEGENVRRVVVGGTSATAKLYAMGASVNGDDGTPIACAFRSFALSADASRPKKLWNDFFLDADPGNASLAVKLYFDNWSSNATPAASPLTGSGFRQALLESNAGRGTYARNAAIDITWSIAAAETPILHRWGGSVFTRPDDTGQRATDFTDCGFWGPKEFRGADIECSASAYDGSGNATPTAKTLVFEYTRDDQTVATVSVAVTVREKSIIPVAFPASFVGYEIRIRPSDANTWKEYRVAQWHFDQLADLTALITPWEGDRLEYIQGLELYADSNSLPVTLSIQKDFAAVASSLPNVTHPGRGWKSYSFAAPFLAYLRRIVPSGPIRLIKWRWIAQPEAPLGDVWETQELELGDPFGFAQYAEIEYASTTVLTFKYYVDGTLVLTDSTELTATGAVDPAVFVKRSLMLPAAKGRLCRVRIESSAQFRIREKGTGIYRKSYGNDAPGLRFASIAGATHRSSGAEV